MRIVTISRGPDSRWRVALHVCERVKVRRNDFFSLSHRTPAQLQIWYILWSQHFFELDQKSTLQSEHQRVTLYPFYQFYQTGSDLECNGSTHSAPHIQACRNSHSSGHTPRFSPDDDGTGSIEGMFELPWSPPLCRPPTVKRSS